MLPELALTMGDIVYRRARNKDYSGILRLQTANYIANLSIENRTEGFLSAEFTPEQIAAIAEDLGIIVALEGEAVAGYLCAFRNEFNHGSPVLAKMFESYERLQLEGKPLSSYKSYVYGPVCIGRDYRKRGLLRGLYEAQKKDLAKGYEIGVAFVSRDNPNSLQAHIAGLRMKELGDFQAKGNTYTVLAFFL